MKKVIATNHHFLHYEYIIITLRRNNMKIIAMETIFRQEVWNAFNFQCITQKKKTVHLTKAASKTHCIA